MDEQRLLFWGQDDRYGYPEKFPIVECMGCGLAFLSVRPHPTAVQALYQKYYSNSKIWEVNSQLLMGWKARLKKSSLKNLYQLLRNPRENPYYTLNLRPGTRVLDVGSGLRMAEGHRVLKAGGEWMAVEVDPSVCRALAAAGLKIFQGTLEQYYETKPPPFDCIILSQVLEHVYQPRQFLGIARELLSAYGKIWLSSPNYDSFLRQKYGQHWLHWHVPYHVAHYNRRTLEILAEMVGLRVCRFSTITPSIWYYTQSQMGKGLSYDDRWLRKNRWQQRLLDMRLASQHRLDRGDAIVAELEWIREQGKE